MNALQSIDGSRSRRRDVLALIVTATALRLVLAASIGLGVDESYAVAVARPFSASYFDHPPLVFWLTGAVTTLVPHANDLLLRLPFILLFAATSWLMFRLTALLFDERAGLYTVVLLSVSPVFTVSTGSWILPDGPLVCAIAAAALCLAHVFFDSTPTDSPRATRWWGWAAVASGLALLSKYHAVLFLIGVLFFLLTEPGARRWRRRPPPYVAASVAVAFTIPVIVWNARHGWVSFRFQGGRAHGPAGLHPEALLQSLGGQAAYLLPWIWAPLVWQFYRGLVAGPRDARRWFLVCLGAVPVVLFTVVSLGGNPGLPHWPAPGFLFFFPLLGSAVARWADRYGAVRVRRWLLATATTSVALVTLIASQIATGWMTPLWPAAFRHGDPSLQALDWTEVRTALTDGGVVSGGDQVIATMHWIDAAKLGRALAPEVRVLCLSDDPRQFRFLRDSAQNLEDVGRDVLLVIPVSADSAADAAVLARARRLFQSVSPVGRVAIHRAGVSVLALSVYSGRGLMATYPLAPSP